MLRKILLLLSIALPLAFFVASCGDDDPDDPNICNTSNLTYTNSIATILNSNCALSGCHGGASYNGSMANYAEAAAFAAGGRIGGAINHDTGFEAMPQNAAKLSDCNIDKIEAWIAAGTPE